MDLKQKNADKISNVLRKKCIASEELPYLSTKYGAAVILYQLALASFWQLILDYLDPETYLASQISL